MRAVVRDQLAEGKTPDDVKAYFVSKYGEWILLAPKPSGFNLFAYAVPLIVVFGGGAIILFAVRRWTSPAPPAADH
jgi:cytochrome c-type biogenesis protein CcmH